MVVLQKARYRLNRLGSIEQSQAPMHRDRNSVQQNPIQTIEIQETMKSSQVGPASKMTKNSLMLVQESKSSVEENNPEVIFSQPYLQPN